MATLQPAKAPAHFWAAGAVSLLWNLYGAYNYIVSMTGRGLTAEEFAWVKGLPAWSVSCWAIGVWGSVLGSVLLLARSRHAVAAFLVSLVGAVISFAYQFSVETPASMHGGAAIVAPVAISIAIIAQWYYARRMTAARVLR